jgi:DNA-binding NarL/FixJ family response regulator
VSASFGKRRVLLVEDDDNMAALIRALLASDRRVEVVGRARHGREALTLAASANPDVILMDLNMPLMDGVEATRRLRELGSTARIVVLTGIEEAMRIKEAREAGADAFVTKVPAGEDLVAVVLAERGRSPGA